MDPPSPVQPESPLNIYCHPGLSLVFALPPSSPAPHFLTALILVLQGAVSSSSADLTVFMSELFAGHYFADPASLVLMTTPVMSAQGIGWALYGTGLAYRSSSAGVWGSPGVTIGFASMTYYDPAGNIPHVGWANSNDGLDPFSSSPVPAAPGLEVVEWQNALPPQVESLLGSANGQASGAVLALAGETWSELVVAGLVPLTTTNLSMADSYLIGPTTQTMTAVLVLQLVEQGQLSLDGTLGEELPDVVLTLTYTQNVTIGQLLEHRSGIPDYLGSSKLESVCTNTQDRMKQYTPSDVVDMINKTGGASFPPGTDFELSNSNYYLLGLVLEDVTGTSLYHLFQEKIFDPLGLCHSEYRNATPNPVRYRGVCWSTIVGVTLDTQNYNPSLAGAAGAVVSTAADMVIFMLELFAGFFFSKPDTLSLMTQQVSNATSLGWVAYGRGIAYVAENVWGFSGPTVGFTSAAFYVGLADPLAIIGWANSQDNPMINFTTGVAEAFGICVNDTVSRSYDLNLTVNGLDLNEVNGTDLSPGPGGMWFTPDLGVDISRSWSATYRPIFVSAIAQVPCMPARRPMHEHCQGCYHQAACACLCLPAKVRVPCIPASMCTCVVASVPACLRACARMRMCVLTRHMFSCETLRTSVFSSVSCIPCSCVC